MRITVGRFDLHDPFADLEDRDVECTPAEVVDRDNLVLLLVQPVGQGGGRRLVDDAFHLESRDPSGVLGGLALRVVEVRRDGDHRLGDLLAEIILGGLLHLLEDVRRDLLRAVILAADAHPHGVGRAGHHAIGDHLHFFVDLLHPAPHEALDGEDRVLGIGDCLPLGDLPNQQLALLGECDHGRTSSRAFGIRYDDRFAALHDGDD